jgi:hypothetical protein
MTGIDVNYKQALTFLPHCPACSPMARPAPPAKLGQFRRLRAAHSELGLQPSRQIQRPHELNYRGRNRRGWSPTGLHEPARQPARNTFVDILGEYRFAKRMSFFFNLRNFTDSPEDFKIYGPTRRRRASTRGSTTRRCGHSSEGSF